MVEECDVEEREEVDEGSGCVIVAGGGAVGLRREIRCQAGPVKGAEEAQQHNSSIILWCRALTVQAAHIILTRAVEMQRERHYCSPIPLSRPPPHAPSPTFPPATSTCPPTCADTMRNGSGRVAPAAAAALPPARGAEGGYELA